tara:strand:- start:24 stop:281 length:258 start_codon:yes stop_codon:yes gene_type:complete
MLPKSDQEDYVLFSDKGIVSEINPGDLILEMSTGYILQLEQQALRIKSYKADFIDAPVRLLISRLGVRVHPESLFPPPSCCQVIS